MYKLGNHRIYPSELKLILKALVKYESEDLKEGLKIVNISYKIRHKIKTNDNS